MTSAEWITRADEWIAAHPDTPYRDASDLTPDFRHLIWARLDYYTAERKLQGAAQFISEHHGIYA